jgi:hypothetical protein
MPTKKKLPAAGEIVVDGFTTLSLMLDEAGHRLMISSWFDDSAASRRSWYHTGAQAARFVARSIAKAAAR